MNMCASGNHDYSKKYGVCGIICAIVLFPCGLICLLYVSIFPYLDDGVGELTGIVQHGCRKALRALWCQGVKPLAQHVFDSTTIIFAGYEGGWLSYRGITGCFCCWRFCCMM